MTISPILAMLNDDE